MMEIYLDEVPNDDFEKYFKFVENLASGAFGKVIRAIDLKTREEVAVKVIDKDMDPKRLNMIKQEINILHQLKHKKIFNFLGYIEANTKLYIAMNLLRGGTITSLLERRKKLNIPLTELECSIVIKNLLEAVRYLHDREIVHRDIKPENIMFENLDDLTSLKLIDFGLSAQYFDSNFSFLYDLCGTMIYMAPEQLEKKAYSKPIDIWSCGIIMYILLNNGRHPLHQKGMGVKQFQEKLRKSKIEYKNKISKISYSLITRLLETNPSKRYTVDKALNHPWITRDKYKEIPETYLDAWRNSSIKRKFKQMMGMTLFLMNFSKNNNKNCNSDLDIRLEDHRGGEKKIKINFGTPANKNNLINLHNLNNLNSNPNKNLLNYALLVNKINKESKEKFNTMRDKHFDPLYSSGEKNLENNIIKNELNFKTDSSSLNSNFEQNTTINANNEWSLLKETKFNFNLNLNEIKQTKEIKPDKIKSNQQLNGFNKPSPLTNENNSINMNNFSSNNNKNATISNLLQNQNNYDLSVESTLSLSPPNSIRNKKSNLIVNKNETNKNHTPSLVLNPANMKKNYKLKINPSLNRIISENGTGSNQSSMAYNLNGKGSVGSGGSKISESNTNINYSKNSQGSLATPSPEKNFEKNAIKNTNFNKRIELKRKSMTIKHNKEFKLDLKSIGQTGEESSPKEKENIRYVKHSPPNTMKPHSKVSSTNYNKLKFSESNFNINNLQKNQIKLNFGSEGSIGQPKNTKNTTTIHYKDIKEINKKIKRPSIKEINSVNIVQHITMNSINYRENLNSLHNTTNINNTNNAYNEKKDIRSSTRNKLKVSTEKIPIKFNYHNCNKNYENNNVPTSINNITNVILPPIKNNNNNNKNTSSKVLNKASSSKQLFFSNGNYI